MYCPLLERKDERGIYRVAYISGSEAHGQPEGLYVDIARFDGTGYSERFDSYARAANRVFYEYGEYPDYAKRR